MTLKTSLFNKGIYKSTVKRYLWGAVLYFVILFMCTVLPILLTVEPDDTYRYMGENNLSLLYENGTYLFLPITIAMGVATVVGLLVYRFLHSKKASVFTHSLPVNRTSVYTSTLAGAFTLMFVSVILNGLIFLVMALTSYSKIISVSSCFVWIGLNLMCLFMMFACTTFVAMLTGNTFATVALNILFHAVVPVVVVCFGFVAEQFLFGYVTDNAVMNSVVENNFVVWIYGIINNTVYWHDETVFNFTKMYIYLGISVLLYVLGWVLYKKRNLETAEDVAGFKILNPIFKYLITFVGVIASFTMFGSFISQNPITFWIIVAIIGVVIYFACEMILKKTLKVWSSYKGLIGFSVVFAIMICVFAFTSFFGYETNVPMAEEVESVAVYSYYYETLPYIDDPGVIDCAIGLHKDFVNKKTLLKDSGDYISMNILYKLKNGDTVSRSYPITENRLREILSDMYKFESYKAVWEAPLRLNVNEIQYIGYQDATERRVYGDMKKELHSCVVEDIKNMSYDELVLAKNGTSSKKIIYCYFDEGYNGIPELFTEIYDLTSDFEKTNQWWENNKEKFGEIYYFFTDKLYEGANFCIINRDLIREMAEPYNHTGFAFTGLSWSKDELLEGNEFCNEITRRTLRDEQVIFVEGEDSKVVYDYVKLSDTSMNDDALWYIYGEISHDEYFLVDDVTAEEAADFKMYVCN